MMDGVGYRDRQNDAKCVGRRERSREEGKNDRKNTSTKIRYDKAFHCLSLSLYH